MSKNEQNVMLKLYTADRYFRKVAVIVIDNSMSNNNKANRKGSKEKITKH